ncbi:ankyrin repeat [Trichoderma cornu-damae]|uniref:Ankyrin repeat n=1 Tax=Trichoderma cornu-damae TaxID=654480 RepID=A0A9P8QJ23_9HYPO|nr:ankyrin repeat [Trichoderma cornu-damae]
MATQTAATEAKTHDDYAVGWVCALPKEQTAATAMLDQRHASLPKPPNDPNTYTLGSIGKHNVVIACLPKGHTGSIPAATVVARMVSTFPSIKVGLMVGIGSGVPPKVKLGDVVVSTPEAAFPGVVQWDFGKVKEGSFERIGSLNNPPSSLLTALTKVETDHELVGSKIPQYLAEMGEKWPRLAPKYLKSDSLKDVLFEADYSHVYRSPTDHDVASGSDSGGEEEESCRFCDKTKVIKRKSRDMRVHQGLIASGNQAIQSAALRDKLKEGLGGHLLCIETEAAGLMNNFPCVIIRGISDYADSHKNEDWEEHAAAAAAAFAKELLEYVQPSDVDGERTVKDILSQESVLDSVSATGVSVSQIKANLDKKEDLEVLDWITKVEYGPQHSDLLRRRQPGTGRWLLDSAEYNAWLATEKQTLFCPGIPGAGKTILTSIVIDHLEGKFQSDPTTRIAYIYCNYRRQEEQGIENLLASLLKQLSRGRASLPDCVKEMYSQNNDKRTRPSLSEILTALHSVAVMYSRVFIIVDALDECQASNGCRQRFLTELFNLQEKCGANCFATSRFIPEIIACFKTTSALLEIRASKEDLERYIRSRIEQLPSFIQERQDLQAEITTVVSEAVDGMFLLAHIYLESLNGKLTPKAVTNALKEFQELNSGSGEDRKAEILSHTYEQAMLRINGQQPGFKDLANKVLSWIVYAERNMTTAEFQHALAVEVGEQKLDEENIASIQDVVSVCAGLVTVDDESNIIRLVHYTTHEYFNQTRNRWFPNAEADIADVCITYLSFSAFEGGPCETADEFMQRLRSHPLYEYAARNWGHHARRASKLRQGATEFLECKMKMSAALQVQATDRDRFDPLYALFCSSRVTGLHLAASFGIQETVGALLAKGVDADPKNYDGQTPLLCAAQGGHEAAVKLLLATPSVNVNSADNRGDTPLFWAAERGHQSVTKLLLAVPNIDLNSGDRYGLAPLAMAARKGHEAIVKLLLAMPDIDVNLRGFGGEAPLSIAAREGHEAIVKLLLAMPTTDVNLRGSRGETPLFIAAEHGHEAITKLLLAISTISPSPENEDGETPLSVAAQKGHEAIVKLLLAMPGIGLNSKNKGGDTPLCRAIQWRHEAVVKLLLAMPGVDVDSVDNSGRTPLFSALWEGGEATVKMLLAMPGIRPDFKDCDGRTPLSRAAGGGHEAIARLLLATAAVDPDSKDKSGLTPLWWAVAAGHEAVAKLLLATPGVGLYPRDQMNQTPLSLAVQNGHEGIVKLLTAMPRVDVSCKDNTGRAPLSWAAVKGHEAIAKLLLATTFVEPDRKDADGRTALSCAAARGHEAIVKLLLDTAGVNPDSKDPTGQTPLALAAANGHAAVVKLLLATERVVPNSQDQEGRTPLSQAKYYRHEAVVELLADKRKFKSWEHYNAAVARRRHDSGYYC